MDFHIKENRVKERIIDIILTKIDIEKILKGSILIEYDFSDTIKIKLEEIK